MTRGFQFVCLLLSLVIAGCGSNPGADSPRGQDGANATGKKLRICLLPKIKGISYFSSCYEGAQEAANELGNIELIYDGPTDGDPRKQAEMIEAWTIDGEASASISTSCPR